MGAKKPVKYDNGMLVDFKPGEYIDPDYSGYSNYIPVTSNYTVLDTDDVVECTSGTFNVTLVDATDVSGKTFTINNSGTGIITLLTVSSQTIQGEASGTVYLYQGDSLSLFSNGTNYIIR